MTDVRIAAATVRAPADAKDTDRKTVPEGIVLHGRFGRTEEGRLLLAVVPAGGLAGIDADIARNGRAVRDAVARSLADGTVVARAVA